ncbi:MAG: gamma-glutamyltransferase family protein, partial [Bacillota bacterium]
MIKSDYLNYPHSSKRNTVFAKNGVVATSQPLAAQAGLRILEKGGNAIDAAIATAAALTVVEPTSNGIGGDAFSIVYKDGKLSALNGSGRSPKSISAEKLRDKGYKKMEKYGWLPVTVPGVPGSWHALSDRFGKLEFKELFTPAIEYAEKGYPITPTLGYFWNRAYNSYKKNLKGEEFENWFRTFAPKGRAPKIGEIWSSKDHAKSLKEIAETKAESFYKGKIADEIAAFSKKYDGYLSKEDLANFEVEWVDPIKVNYKGYDVWEIPPNGQGLSALMALGILKEYDFNERESVERYHKQIEAMKLAMTDGKAYITDIDEMSYQVEELLSDKYLTQRRKLISDKAILPEAGKPEKGGTVYLATADKDGNMVSYIQSNYMGFGSGLVVPNRGIALQNRGHLF